jgi:hypothetical protein
MRRLANKPNQKQPRARTRYRKSDGIATAFLWQSRATGCVSHIAELAYFIIRRARTVMAWSGTISVKARAQWKARGMQPCARIVFL